MPIIKRKKTRYIFIIIIALFLITGGTIFMSFFNKKKENTEIIDSYIVENNYESIIQEKEILYDWKQGTYYAKVIFEDEPQNYYEIYVQTNSDNVYVIGFDKDQNKEITDKNKAKYING
ncbi:DUF3139 domain-containing protein [Amphibacillus cookii]|uniref:DUF3139 domain-containing protein n=1 Tax=Amphibacillus cookii TaxID=767787 RepID=UPI0019584D08|nr:DUF3139 domain-containing protein [Amphibacillus cookii]MBM7541214.1 flagellar basal body-associated protein FliL [Amphibacillus cookii]